MATKTKLKNRLLVLKFLNDERIKVKHASEVIEMHDSASAAIRSKPDASVRVAFELIKAGDACGVVSPGNTGAMMAAGLVVSGALPGVGRPAIASLIPKIGDAPPTVLLDSGANVDCHAHQLVQFALMGNYYSRSAFSLDSPRVALLSNGSEISKGNDIIRSTALILSDLPGINYIGFIEGRDISKDVADVVVCDGFVGNIVLKTMEGAVELVFDSLKQHVDQKGRGKFGMWMAKPVFKTLFNEKLDPSAYGGAPLLGLNDIAIVCHGSSTSRAIFNAIRVAQKFADDEVISQMVSELSTLDLELPGTYEDGMWDRMGKKFEKKSKTKE